MKRRGWFVLLMSIGLVLMFAGPTLAQVIKLTLADQNPEMGWGPVHALQPWVKKVEEATKGKVKIDVFYSQTLVKRPALRIWGGASMVIGLI
jgi:TRAP-type C4-dicarboxylate transport system substrate-binding protein